MCAGGVATATANAQEGPVKADVAVNAIQGLSEDFIGGMDISSMLSLEESGVTFKNADGEVEDLFALLKESGVNYVRLRVWNDPFTAASSATASSATTASGSTASGSTAASGGTSGVEGYGGGNVNADRALVMAKRATSAGLKVLVDFHYSDFWADPSKQQTPKAWKSFEGNAQATADAVYDYTKDTLTKFKQAGVDVGMVQVGNETTAKIAGISGWDGMSKVFSAGSKAVREVLPSAKVAIHFTNPEKAGTYATYARQLDSHKVDYDVFASSYYPFWHGSTQNLTNVLKSVAATYKKDVMVAETSWAYTLEDGDDDSNTVPSKVAAADLKKYDISPQGQADEIRAVAEAVNNVGDNDGDGMNDGIGVFYWEPAWIPVGTGGKSNADLVSQWNQYGAGWATAAAGEYDAADAGLNWGGSGVDNQALFDFQGRALASLPIFEYIRTGAITDHVFSKIDPVAIAASDMDTVESIKSQLPGEVSAQYKDGVNETETVTWQSDALDWIRGAGTYTIPGTTTAGHDVDAIVTVTATKARDYVIDGGFEVESNDGNWAFTGAGASIGWENPSEGKRALKFWSDKAYRFSTTQTIRGLESGDYILTATSEGALVGGKAGTNTVTLNASNGSGETNGGELELNGWNQWHTATVSVRVGEDGIAVIAITGDLAAGDWGSVDEVSLTRKTEDAPKPSTAKLDAAIAAAKAVKRDGYTNDSLSVLDKALVSANVLLSGSTYSAQDVSDMAMMITNAIDGLVGRQFISISVTAGKTTYQVGDTIAAKDLNVVGNYSAGMGSIDLAAGDYTLDYDFSTASAAAKVIVSLKSNPNITETYTVTVQAKPAGGSTSPGGNAGDASTPGEGESGGTGDSSGSGDASQSGSVSQSGSGEGENIAGTGASVIGIAAVSLIAVLIAAVALVLRRDRLR
jgi:arabinogalactan endo-1,4-beta-galactosidase